MTDSPHRRGRVGWLESDPFGRRVSPGKHVAHSALNVPYIRSVLSSLVHRVDVHVQQHLRYRRRKQVLMHASRMRRRSGLYHRNFSKKLAPEYYSIQLPFDCRASARVAWIRSQLAGCRPSGRKCSKVIPKSRNTNFGFLFRGRPTSRPNFGPRHRRIDAPASETAECEAVCSVSHATEDHVWPTGESVR